MEGVALQSLLASLLDQLRARTGCQRAMAWLRREDGALLVAASLGSRLPPPPDAADLVALDAAWKLERAFDFSAPGLDAALRDLGERHEVSAGRCLRGADGEPLAVLLVGQVLRDSAQPEHASAELLAALDAGADELATPLATLRAARRLARLDGRVQRLHRLASLGELLAEAVHEIRNPLVSVKTFLQLLPGREHDPEFTGEFRQVVMEELARLERLLAALSGQARPLACADAGEGADVAECLASVAGLLKHRALDGEVELEAGCHEGLPRVSPHADALRQILLNLTLNAIAATPARGRVRLRAEQTARGVEIAVEDEGPGVPPGERERIFEPFHSTKGDGVSGLGLAITARLVAEAGGAITVADAGGGGARFIVSLPTL